MFLYGHMLEVKDTFMHDGQRLRVMDAWPSRYLGGQWVELWTDDSNTIARCVTIVHVPDFKPIHDVRRERLLVGTSRKYHGVI